MCGRARTIKCLVCGYDPASWESSHNPTFSPPTVGEIEEITGWKIVIGQSTKASEQFQALHDAWMELKMAFTEVFLPKTEPKVAPVEPKEVENESIRGDTYTERVRIERVIADKLAPMQPGPLRDEREDLLRRVAGLPPR